MERKIRYNNGIEEDKLREECGVFGIYDPNKNRNDLSQIAYFGLFALQHRGQESAGIAVSNGKETLLHKGMGLVSDVFDDSNLTIRWEYCIGSCCYLLGLYSTNAQPLVVRYYKGSMALSHNGNIINANKIKQGLENMGLYSNYY